MDDEIVNAMEHGNIDEELAKRIYIEHMGSSFYMERAGVYETYRSWNIDPRKEAAWAKEKIGEILSYPIGPEMISGGGFNHTISLILNSKDSEGLGTLLKKVEELKETDTMSLIRIARELVNLLKSVRSLRIQEFKSEAERAKCLLAKLLARASSTRLSVAPIYIERNPLKERPSDAALIKEIDIYNRMLQAGTEL